MKKRTRLRKLRKLGLLPTPPAAEPPYPVFIGAAILGLTPRFPPTDPLVRQLLEALKATPLDSSWALNAEMQADARHYGVDMTVKSLSQTGYLPSHLFRIMQGGL